MTLKLMKFAFMCVLVASFPLQASAAPVSIKYYENGKRIPAPTNAPPFYPYKEQKRRIGGTVIVAYSFGRDGKVTAASVKTSSGNKNLDAAAVEAVRKWTVTPPMKDGVPQAAEAETPVVFIP